MVELLRQGGVSASYQVGTITLNGAQFYNWSGFTDAKSACQFLADGAIPATVNGASSCGSLTGNVTSVVMGHSYATSLQSWISSYNANNQTNLQVEDIVGGGVIDTTAAFNIWSGSASPPGYSTPTAQYTWTGDIPDQFRTQLTVQFANISQAFFADESAGKRLRLWGYYNATTTVQTMAMYLESKFIAVSNLPNATVLGTITLIVNHPYAADGNGDGVLGDYADDTLVRQIEMDATATGMLNYSTSVALQPVVTIVQGWGEAGQSSVTHYVSLQHRAEVNPNGSDPNNIAISQNLVPLINAACVVMTGAVPGTFEDGPCGAPEQGAEMANWLVQTSRARDLQARVAQGAMQHHHSLGYIVSDGVMSTVGGTTNPFIGHTDKLNIESALSANSKTSIAADRQAMFNASGANMSRLEGGVLEQTMDAWEGGSGISLMVKSNDTAKDSHTAIAFLQITSANQSSAIAQLSNYSASAISRIQSYTAAGYTLVVPQNGMAGNYTFTCCGGYSATMGFLSNGLAGYMSSRIVYLGDELKGATGASNSDPGTSVSNAARVADYASDRRKYYGVDVAAASLQLTPPPDLTTGNGPFPYSLSYQRFYDPLPDEVASANDIYKYQAGNIGAGWTHSFVIQGSVESDGMAGMGRDGALDAASAIAGLYTLRGLNASQSMQSVLASIITTNWWVGLLQHNTTLIQRGNQRSAFVRLADGTTLNARPGSKDQLTQAGALSFLGPYTDGSALWNYGALSFTLTYGDGSRLAFGYGGDKSVNSNNIVTNFYVPQTWTFPTGVVLSFTNTPLTNTGGGAPLYLCLSQVANNLGHALNFPCDSSTVRSWVADENNRKITFSLGSYNAAGANTLTVANATPFYITGVDGGITRYDYLVDQSVSIYTQAGVNPTNQTYQKITRWYTPDDANNPYLTADYDTTFRVKDTVDNSSAHYTTQYFSSTLFGSENQKRGEILDPLGAVTTRYFDVWNNKLSEIDPLGRATYFSYDSSRRLVKRSFPELNYDTYAYDARSNLLNTTHYPKPGSTLSPVSESITYMEGPSVTTCASPATCNQPATSIDANNNPSTYAYFSSASFPSGTGQLQRVTGPAVSAQSGGVSGNAQTDYCFGAFSASSGTISLPVALIKKVDAATNRVTSYTYNTPANHLTLQTVTVDPATTYVPPSAAGGSCTTTTKSGALALTTSYSFDAVGNLATKDGPIPGTVDLTTYTFDSMRRLTTVAAPLSATTRYCYDADGQMLSTNRARVATTDPNASTASTTGQCPSAFPTSAWQSETKTYFPTGDLKTSADAQGNTIQYAYDADGRVQVIQDPDGRQKATVYDLAGEVIAEWRGGSGWINSSTGAPTGTWPTSWTPSSYTGSGPLRYQSYCNGASDCYYPNGHRKYAVDADNNMTEYQYDGLDRLIFTYFPDPSSGTSLCTPAANDGATPNCTGLQTYEKSAYDNNGNRTSLRTRKGDTISYHFDALNRQDIKSAASQGAVTTGFDLLGEPYNIAKAAFGGNQAHTTTYSYDGAGRVLTETNDGLPVGHQYDTLVSANDNAGNRTRTTWPDGYFVTYQYDALNRMVDVRENSTTTNELAYYTYDPLSARQSVCLGGGTSGACPGGTWTNRVGYSYEPDGQLNGLTHYLNGTTVTFGYGRNHSYQLTGLNVSDSFYLPSPTASASTGYSPNALNQYSAVGGQSATYDGNGNLLTWYSALPSAGMHTYTYDSENRLSTAAVNGSTTATISYDYDGLGRRVSKTVAGVATTYLLDGDEEIAEYSGATVLRRYITGPGVDDRIAHAEGFSISSPTKTFYHTDHEGSVVDVTDAAGNATQRMSYDEYGNLSAGSTATGEPFRYTGRRYDPETGLYYYRARYYSPQLGRFLQPDPIGYQDDLNLYTYAGNDPLDKTDPSGRIAGVDDAAEVGVVLVGAAALYVAAETCTPGSACERAASAGLGWIGDKASAIWNHIVHNESATKPASEPSSNAPDRTANDELRKDSRTGQPQPDPEAAGTEHSQLGTRDSKSTPGETYPQAREFDANGKPVRDIDFTDHGRPAQHPNPHEHPRGENATGGTSPRGAARPLPEPVPGPQRSRWWPF